MVNGVILFAASAGRSMQFGALTFTTFAEIAPEERSSATVLFSLAQQISREIRSASNEDSASGAMWVDSMDCRGRQPYARAVVVTGR